MKLLPTVFLVVTVCSFGASIDLLCPLKWPNCGLTVQNIVCERGETCPTEPGCEKIEPDEELLKFILHEHNRLRNEIATGKETRGHTGPAANMNALSYDKGLEFTASCNANMCKFQHDKCRATKKFPNAGQNLFYTSGNQSELRGAVAAWFEEITLNTPDVIDKFPKGRHDIGHFTQMIWAKTTHIGCAMAKSLNQEENVEEYYLTCNYAPQGNMIGRTVYERGTGCSKCPKSRKCNLKYPGLCGDVDETQIKQGSRGATMNEDSVTANSGSVASAATGGVTDRGVTEEGVTEKDITQDDAPKESAIAQNATENAITGNYTTDSSAENGTVTQQSVETTTHNSASIINSCLHLVIAIILVELFKD